MRTDKRYDDLLQLYLDRGMAMDEKDATIETLTRQRDEARAALKPWASIGKVILAEAPSDSCEITIFTDCEGCQHRVTLDAFRSALKQEDGK